MAPLLQVNSLKMYYEVKGGRSVKAVDDVSVSLEEGKSLGLAGESGCGKTSLALTIMRSLPYNGRIFNGGILLKSKDILKLDDEAFRRQISWKIISMVPQAAMNALNPVIKVGDQIVETIMLHENVNNQAAKERVRELFELVGLDPTRANHYTHEFSGGMRQRAMIAMALACNPKIVITDEPTTALDVIIQAQILKLLRNLQKRLNMSLLLITHDLSTISEICETVAIMYAGKIVEYGPTSKVYEEPLHPYTHGLLAAVPSIKGRRRRLSSIPGAPPNLLNPPSGCRFYPRCPNAEEICRKKEPPMVKLGNNRLVACHKIG